MKETLSVSGNYTTAGVDLQREHSIVIQEINGIKCIAVHKCHEKDGLHYSAMSEETLVSAIPVINVELPLSRDCPTTNRQISEEEFRKIYRNY